MAATDLFAGEIATELFRLLIYITRKAYLCKPHAEQLILTINELLPIITDIKHSGVELNATSQHQLKAIYRSLTDGRELAVKVLRSSRWNVYQNLQLSRKMKILENELSRLVQGPLPKILSKLRRSSGEQPKMAATDFFAGEIATEFLRMLIYITRKAYLCKPHAEQLIPTIDELLPIITDIKHFGVELNATSQYQLKAISRSLTDGHKLAVKALGSSRWNVYQNLQLSRKMEKLEKELSRLVQGLLPEILSNLRRSSGEQQKIAATDIFAGEIATEFLRMLITITRKAYLCKQQAEQLIVTINELLPIITDIKHSGVELTATSQHQLKAISRSLTDGHELAVKVLGSSRWNVYKNLQLSRKMEKLEKEISRLVQGPLQAELLAHVYHARFDKSDRVDRIGGRAETTLAREVCRDDDDVNDLHQRIMPSIEELNDYVQIPLQDILSATNNFSNENRIGLGGFGKVYKGESEKHGIIAVKRWDSDRGKSGHGDHEFRTEIRLLSIYKHENIASLRGFCDEDGEKILVYKYEINGSLDKHLQNKDLSWAQRLRICLDAARGLMYLHDGVGFEGNILHRDVKSANILLDENWKAKISDFGLSRNGPGQSSFVISNGCGTLGYIDPEYITTGHLTQKSDVFSFGVVLFEVMCGRFAFCKVDGQFFNVWVQKHY